MNRVINYDIEKLDDSTIDLLKKKYISNSSWNIKKVGGENKVAKNIL
jgi:hypothetical protein